MTELVRKRVSISIEKNGIYLRNMYTRGIIDDDGQ